MSAVALGLAAALCWGIADVLARFASRAVGAYRSLLYGQLVGAAALTLALLPEHGLADLAAVPAAGWAWGIVTGAVFAGAALAFYHAMETGLLALVSPIAGSYAAVTVLLALLTGEALTGRRAAGIAAALVGVMLASLAPATPASSHATTDPGRAGVGWALVAALGFGVTFWLLGFRVTPAFGGLASVWVLRTTGALVLLAAARPARVRVGPPRGRVAWLLVGVGALDTLAFVANNVGTTRGLVSVVSVLGSLFSAVTLLIAWVALGERLAPRQWCGVVLVLAGVALVNG